MKGVVTSRRFIFEALQEAGMVSFDGPKIYPKAHENPRAFSCIFGPIIVTASTQSHTILYFGSVRSV